jgi:pyruvate,orthophosphate dikinase
MTRLGLPVPPGFTITTDVCRVTMSTGQIPADLWSDVDAAVSRLEKATGRAFGAGPVPILLSVRSGAKFSMPGMMDSVLNLGVNDDVVEPLIDWSGNPHFAWDAYRRFVQMYATVVLDVDDQPFQDILSTLRVKRGVRGDSELSTDDLERATRMFQAIVQDERPGEIPPDPREQLQTAIAAIFASWSNKRAIEYRRINRIPDSLGTAANVQMMVFGDLDNESGTGVCFTRDPATGARVTYGDYLPRAQGEDVVAGIRNTMTLDEMSALHPECHRQLLDTMSGLEKHYKDMLDIEFTIEKGVLYILQVRAGKRTAQAAVRLAVTMANEDLIDKATAVTRVAPSSLEQLHRPRLDPNADTKPILSAVAASPGAATGVVVFDADAAVEMAKAGKESILVRPSTTPDDIHGMAAASGILTSHGGKTSHAAVVARGMGKPAVTGAANLLVDVAAGLAQVGEIDISAGDLITIDGTTGTVYTDRVDLIAPEKLPDLNLLLEWADEIRTMGVWANADTPDDAAEARRRGASGIGLARTEHMFMGDRIQVVQKIILSEEGRTEALEELERLQVGDFEGILEAMDGLPVVIRLLDPPLHEFLPSRLELEKEALRRVRAGRPIDDLTAMSQQVARWEEVNPMLGLRGVRLGLMFDEIYRMQARAAVNAVTRRLEADGNPVLEIMIPLVATVEELRRMKVVVEEEIAMATARTGREYSIPIGTMIELPRAALTAGEIAEVAAFFSFGTNDLTQMTYGLSRDDAEQLFLKDYIDQRIFPSDPFQTLDQEGVGRLMRIACREGRAANPDLTLGLCGEHGGDPDSIAFAHGLGLDYVSCSPPRVEGARLAAAQAELGVG